MALRTRIDREMGAKYLDIKFCQVTECIAAIVAKNGGRWDTECQSAGWAALNANPPTVAYRTVSTTEYVPVSTRGAGNSTSERRLYVRVGRVQLRVIGLGVRIVLVYSLVQANYEIIPP